jgi:hypothetical protein
MGSTKWPLLTTISTGLAMASTLIVFLTVSRNLGLEDIGRLSLVVALGSLAHQLTDAGFGNLMVRNANQGSGRVAALKWLVRKRLRRAIWVLPLVVILGFANRLNGEELLCILGLSLFNSLYSLAMLSQNAERNWGKQVILQAANFLGFTLTAVAYLEFGFGSLQESLWSYLFAWLLPVAVALYFLLPKISLKNGYRDSQMESKDARSFPKTLYANLFTTMAVIVATTGLSPELSGGYGQVQQLSIIFAPLSIAATNWFLPNLSRSDNALVQKTASRALKIAFPLVVVGGLVGFIFHWLLRFVLGYEHLSLAGIIISMSASGLGVATAVLTTCFVAIGMAQIGARLALLQAALTTVEVIVAVLTKNLEVVLGLEFLIRVIGFMFLLASYRRLSVVVAERVQSDT